MNRGEIWWVEDPAAGRRPHLIVSRQSALPHLHAYLSVPTTRTARGLPTEVALTRDDGLPSDCVLTLDNLTVLPRAFFVERISQLRGDRMAQVCTALAYATDCD